MKKFYSSIALIMIVLMLTSCGPAKKDIYKDIESHETAFVVPMTGANKSTQKEEGFGSIEYLEERKVASKRIFLEQKKISTGRFPWNFKYIIDTKVITVSRAAVSLEWDKNNPIRLESDDSIGFFLGGVITGHINEIDTAKYLYNYPSASLRKILDTEVKTFIASEMSHEFGNKPLDKCRSLKSSISKNAFNKAKKYFKENKGITLDVFGIVGGLTYDDVGIQASINKTFAATMAVNTSKQEALRAEAEKTKTENIAKGEALAKNQRTDASSYEIKIMADAKAYKILTEAESSAKSIKIINEAITPQYIEYLRALPLKNWKGELPNKVTNVNRGKNDGGMILQLTK